MGGRSREYQKDDRWSWLQDLSDKRLENYGQMAAKSLRRKDKPVNAKSKQLTLDQREALYFHVVNEYERRNGEKPSWFSN